MNKEEYNNSINSTEAKGIRKYRFHVISCHSQNSILDNLFLLKIYIFRLTLFTSS